MPFVFTLPVPTVIFFNGYLVWTVASWISLRLASTLLHPSQPHFKYEAVIELSAFYHYFSLREEFYLAMEALTIHSQILS